MITMLNLTWTMNMVPWKGTPFTNRGILLFRVVFSCQLNGIQLFFLQNLETSLLLKPLGVCEIHVPPLETSPNKVKLIWIDFMIDSIWFELIWFSYYHHVRPLFSGGCFFLKKNTPPKKLERSFSSQTLKVQGNTNPISIAWGSHLKKHPAARRQPISKWWWYCWWKKSCTAWDV